jgi:uncharacterized protein YggE
MNRLHHLATVTKILVVMAFLAWPLQAQDAAHGPIAQITVSGEGVIKTLPDIAHVEFAIVTRNERPDRARVENADASADALNAIRALGVEEKDIQLQNLQLGPLREYDPDKRTYIEKGYEATRSLMVTVRDLEMLPDLIATLVDEGANRMNSIQYGLDDRDEIELKVLQLAVARAKQKAMVMAEQLGVEVGVVLQLNEQGISVPSPVMRMEASFDLASSKGSGNPDAYASGQIEVRANVIAVFRIK